MVMMMMYASQKVFFLTSIQFSLPSYTFILRLSKNTNLSKAEDHECSKPPLVVDIPKGYIFYVAVALKDTNGYLSLWSQLITVEKAIGKILFCASFWLKLWSLNVD